MLTAPLGRCVEHRFQQGPLVIGPQSSVRWETPSMVQPVQEYLETQTWMNVDAPSGGPFVLR
jgi:hypothetical protein